MEAVVIYCLIYALYNIYSTNTDVSGYFMKADRDKNVTINLVAKMAALYVQLDTNMYRNYLIRDKGKTVLYAEISKDLYGTLTASRMFWNNLTKS